MSRGIPEGEKSEMEAGVWGLEKFEMEDRALKPAQWGAISSRVFKAFSSSHSVLPAGAYAVTRDNNDDKPLFVRKDIKSDQIIRFDGSLAYDIAREISEFWNRGEKFKTLGFLHRRGYLLYGSQGTGKTSIVQQIIQDVIERNGIVLFCENPKFFSLGLAVFRQIEPERPLVCVFEDMDAIIKRYQEDELLAILDGANQVDRVLNIATTNYPEYLDKRIISRPRRFDRVLKVEVPNEQIRREYFVQKLPQTADIEEWVAKTSGLSFSGLTEAIISVECLGNPLKETISILTDIENGHPSSSDFGTKAKAGFVETEEDDDDEDEENDRE